MQNPKLCLNDPLPVLNIASSVPFFLRIALVFVSLLVIFFQSGCAGKIAETASELADAGRTEDVPLPPNHTASESTDKVGLSEREVSAVAIRTAVRINHPLHGHLGHGVIVSSSRSGFDVITANHVIADSDACTVVWSDPDGSNGQFSERESSFKVILRDAETDLAHLRVTASNSLRHSLSLSNGDAHRDGREFIAWIVHRTESGSTVAESTKVISRQLARRTAEDKLVSYWRLDRAGDAGMSGGALIDQAGRLIGIASGNSRDNAYYCDDRELAKFFVRMGLNVGPP